MFAKLKRHATIQLSLTIFLTISVLMIIYYYFYSKVLYDDYITKSTSLSEIYAQNVDNYLNQIDKYISVFANFTDIASFENGDRKALERHISDCISNIMRNKVDRAISDIAVVSDDGIFVNHKGYITEEYIKESGILDILSKQPHCVRYNSGYTGNSIDCILYGKTIYNADGSPHFYVIETLGAKLFAEKVYEKNYFTKDASVYIKFGDESLTVSESNATKAENLQSDGFFAKRNIKSIPVYNSKYNIYVVTNIDASSKAISIGFLRIIFTILCLVSGIIGFIFSKKIIRSIISPLERTHIKINKNAFEQYDKRM